MSTQIFMGTNEKDGVKIHDSDEPKTDKHGNKEGTFGYIFANGNRQQRRKARKELELRIRKDLKRNNKKYGEKKGNSESQVINAKKAPEKSKIA